MGKKNRISIPSARKDRQKIISDVYRDNYNKIRWNKKKPTKEIKSGG